MPTPPILECPEIDAAVTTANAVHLIIRVRGDWDVEREVTTAEVERRVQAATAFAGSPQFRERFAARIGVVRVQSPRAAPSIVAHLLAEQGVELENLDGEQPADGPTCSACSRPRLTAEQAQMTDEGWACPSCFRAWMVRRDPQLSKKRRRLRIPQGMILPLIILVAALFFFFVFRELHLLNKMNSGIRQHLPT